MTSKREAFFEKIDGDLLDRSCRAPEDDPGRGSIRPCYFLYEKERSNIAKLSFLLLSPNFFLMFSL